MRDTSRSKSSTKLWRVRSTEYAEIFWVRARTKPECKKILRKFLRSREYWEGDPQEEFVPEIFKAYTDYKDCPGLRVDETRGDVMYNLVDPSRDWIDKSSEENNDTGKGSKKEKETEV